MPRPVSVTRTSTDRSDRVTSMADRAAGRCELHRVAEQVDEHLLEAERIADDEDLGELRHVDVHALGFGERHDGFHSAADVHAQIDVLQVQRRAAGHDAGHVEQFVDQVRLPRRVAVNGFDRARAAALRRARAREASSPSRAPRSAAS